MFKGIDALETFEYVSPNDPGEPKTVFVLSALRARDKINLLGEAFDIEGRPDQKKITAKLVDIVLAGLKSVRGLVNVKTDKAENFDVINLELIEKLPTELVMEVGNEIVKKTFVSEQERGN